MLPNPTFLLYLFLLLLPVLGVTQPTPGFHLTAGSWESREVSQVQLLEVIEASCSVAARFQNDLGAIVDPYLGREHQYATPYFAYAVGTLLHAGRGKELREAGIRAMEHSLNCLGKGSQKIPDAHGEFYLAPLAKALDLYRPFIGMQQLSQWEEIMRTPLETIMENQEGRINNWRTYAMKGEWDRAKHGLVDRGEATAFIEKAWLQQTQRARILTDKYNLYQDWSSDPQSLAVEAVGRGNLLGLVLEGYDGPSASEIEEAIFNGTHATLYLQSPDGQAPANGRTDNHVFNDVLYFLSFEVMANIHWNRGERRVAGQYKQAANLAFHSILRWQRSDPGWAGSFSITKNFFDHADRIGYQPASQWGNYTGTLIYHLAEAWHIRNTEIAPAPAPSELGGFVLETDPKFGTFTANAGGLQVVVNLRGASIPKYGQSWTPLGTIRISKSGWDARLGPSDGIHDLTAGTPFQLQTTAGETLDNYRYQSAVTLGPEWKERNHWVRIGDLPANYQAIPEVHFVHPLLVRFSVHYTYVTGRGGTYFTQDFILTPDAVVTSLRPLQPSKFGLTVPLLENDGRPLEIEVSDRMASTKYPDSEDSQHFIALNDQVHIDQSAPSLQSSVGWLKPLRFSTEEPQVDIVIYPRKGNDPLAESVAAGFRWTSDGFESALGKVFGTTYLGRWAGGGSGKTLDLNQDGKPDLVFDEVCNFVVRHHEGTPTAVESDRDVRVSISDNTYSLQAFVPLFLK
jgi:hypothetical protein